MLFGNKITVLKYLILYTFKIFKSGLFIIIFASNSRRLQVKLPLFILVSCALRPSSLCTFLCNLECPAHIYIKSSHIVQRHVHFKGPSCPLATLTTSPSVTSHIPLKKYDFLHFKVGILKLLPLYIYIEKCVITAAVGKRYEK